MLSHTPSDSAYRDMRSAAEYLGVTEKTIRRRIAEGKLPAYRLGPRQIRIKQADLDKLLRPIPATGDVA